ncbi:MAG: uroporphyrinogen-III C-methyltransferase [Mariniphaga sp.]
MSNLSGKIKVICPNNPAVLKMAAECFAQIPDLDYDLIRLEDKSEHLQSIQSGDPLTLTGSLFQFLSDGGAEIAILAAPDLPFPMPQGLHVLAILDSDIPKDFSLNPEYINLEQLPEESDPLDGYLAIVALEDKPELKRLFETADIRRHFGKVTLVGFGPGNPDLLTLGGDKALMKADIIFHDDLLDQEFCDQYDGAKFYVGKRKDCHSFRQDRINRLLFNAAKAGKCVVRLKGGDPMVFAHGGEELEYLHRNFVEVTVIPGVSAGIAVAAYTQIPLTHRGISSSVAFVSGHSDSVQIPQTDTLVCFMGGYNMQMIARKAIASGKRGDTPVMLVHNISLPDQKEFFSTLEELSVGHEKYPTPIIIVIGKVVALRNNSELEVLKPVFLVTGTSTEKYNKLGTVIHQPLIEINRIEPNSDLEQHLTHLDQFDWIFFTSRYTVQFFFEFLNHYGKDSRALAHHKIASMGKLTSQALKKYGILPDLEPADGSSDGLIKEIETRKIRAGHVLIPRSNLGLEVLPDNLLRLGWSVTRPSFYENKFPDNLKKLDLNRVQTIVFPAPSCVTNFVRLYGELPKDKKYIFRGKETEKRFLELKQ